MERKRYTVEEKLKHIREMRKKGYSYGEMVEKRGIPKTTLQRWVVLYEKEGKKGFEKKHKGNSNGRRGKAGPKFIAKKDEDLLKRIERLEAENEYLKKLNALVQERQNREKRQK